MSKLESELTQVETALNMQARLVEQMVALSFRGLQERCVGTAADVRDLECKLDASEVEIEKNCLTILALHQPVAFDLRRVATVLRVNSDLERIGDLALNLAERTESLTEFPEVNVSHKLTLMVKTTLQMLRDVDRALSERDTELAHAVAQRDEEVDQKNVEMIQELSSLMQQDADKVPGYLHVFSACRIVERMAAQTAPRAIQNGTEASRLMLEPKPFSATDHGNATQAP